MGTIRIGRNPSFALVTAVAVVLSCSLLAYAVLGEVVRKARISGILMPIEGTLNLSSPQAGTLSDLRVKEGDPVVTGQPLATVRTDRTTSEGEIAILVAQTLEQRRSTLQSERAIVEAQFKQRQIADAERLKSLAQEERRAQEELLTAQGRLSLSAKSVARFAELARSGYVSDIQLQQKQEELLDLTSRESTVQRSLLALQRDQQAIRNETAANANSLQSQMAQIEQRSASLQQERTENAGRREIVITSPASGTVTALMSSRGQLVQGGQTIASVVPLDPDGHESRLEAQLFAPSRTAGFVQPGQDVWVRYAAYSYQKFGMAHGRIERVSRTPIGSQDLPVGQAQALMATTNSAEPLYRITVALDQQGIRAYGAVHPLKAGTTLEADVVQERRRIWEWLFEPVLAGSGLGPALAPVAP